MAETNTAAEYIARELARGRKANRLLHEQSPYLLQHAFNPVPWYPWGEEAFARARAEDKPIFLSIGYSTCHWCHVMARESFADPEIAALLGEHFVAVKVDREERPDIDQIYMAATQALSGGGGWPMSLFLTPDLEPFFAGTYFPPEPRHNLPSFRQLLISIHATWIGRREKVLESAAAITDHLRVQAAAAPGSALLDDNLLSQAYRLLEGDFDRDHGGFGRQPKFPRPVVLHFLLRHHVRTGEPAALDMVLLTLRRMAAGGIYDHVGGGFHRYAVDRAWRVPHFEKMLYDQGQLAVAYLEAYQLSGDPFYASVATDILDYVLRDLQDPAGGFYSAEDADSPDPADAERHGEGLFYLWSEAEVLDLLGPGAGRLFCYHYGIESAGNAPDDPHGEFAGRNILHVARSLEETARHFDQTPAEVAELLDQGRARLFVARSRRPRPHLDDKILTAWNGHMISALARGFQVLGGERYRSAAVRAGRFFLDRMTAPEGGALLRRYRAGHAGLAGQLDDYAFFIQALLDLYNVDFDVAWLKSALKLTERQITLFHDPREGGFYDVADTDPTLLFRTRADYDGAEPTGNSVAALNLLRLARTLGVETWERMAGQTIAAFARRLQEYPASLPLMLAAYDLFRRPPRHLVITGRAEEEGVGRLLDVVRRRFLPDLTVLLADGGPGQEWLSRSLPFVATMGKIGGRPTAYLCQGYVCGEPTTEPAELESQLAGPLSTP
ncbi:MAG: thioredoxin domain-containing protein [Thermodesulfobacteriota bacterium]